jgi:hypothetical protein
VNEAGDKAMTEVCPDNCMLFWMIHFLPITPRLKWLILSKRIARHMRWHKEGIHENDRVLVHPSDGEAWKALDNFDAYFASDARNVCIGLATDDFSPFSTNSTPYSYWSTFVILYNLTHSLCMNPREWLYTPGNAGYHDTLVLEGETDEV